MGAKKIKKPTSKGCDGKRPLNGMNDREWDKFMQTVEEIKKEADQKLQEISSICLNRECDGKRS